MDVFTIKEIGGGRDLKTVLRYVHRNKMDLHIAMNEIDGILESLVIHENDNILEMKKKTSNIS